MSWTSTRVVGVGALAFLLFGFILSTPTAIKAEDFCTGDCECPCTDISFGCVTLCPIGFANCRDGQCDGLNASCCCVLFFPFYYDCFNKPCGITPPGCYGPIETVSDVLDPKSGEVDPVACERLFLGPENRWAYFEFEVEPNGWRPSSFVVHAASENRLANMIEQCLDAGAPIARFDRQASARQTHRIFTYEPGQSEGLEQVRRIFLYQIPPGRVADFATLNGRLALRFTTTTEGEILDRELLFSTDPVLGQLILDSLEEGLVMVEASEHKGPFTDVLDLTVLGGQIAGLRPVSFVASER